MAKSDRLLKNNGRVRKWRMYDRLLATRLHVNFSNKGIVRNGNFYIDYKGFYSENDNVTYMYTVERYPRGLDIDYRDRIRECCVGSTRINFIDDFEYDRIKWDSMEMRSKMRTWKAVDSSQGGTSVYDLYDNIDEIDTYTWIRSSVKYQILAEKKYGRKSFRVRSVILVSGKRGEDFDETIQNLLLVCRDNLSIGLTRVLYNIQNYLEVFSPFSTAIDMKISRLVSNILAPDQILARLNTYSQGSVGKFGVWIGNDMQGRPVVKPVKSESVKAENILISGETGSGKSVQVKNFTGQLLAKPEYNGTYMDVEGNEYLSWAYLIANGESVVILNMAEGSGKYLDPVEIILTGNKHLDKEMYNISYSFTRSLLRALVGVGSENNYWIDGIIKSCIDEFYESIGVKINNMLTWKNSKGYDIFDIIDAIPKYKVKNEEQKISLDLCVENITTNSKILREKVNIYDVVRAKLVICSFGMAGRAETSIDPVNMNIMQLSSAYVSYLRSIFSKADGKYNFKVWEEFQRWGHFPGSASTIGVALTGGRKLGDINIISTNKLSELLKNDELNILENIQTYMIGAIDEINTRKEFCRIKSIQNLEYDLNMIASNAHTKDGYIQGDVVEENEYTHAFLCCLDGVRYVITKVSLPEDILNSELFFTGVSSNE